MKSYVITSGEYSDYEDVYGKITNTCHTEE